MILDDILKVLSGIASGSSFIIWVFCLSVFINYLNLKTSLPRNFLFRIYFMLIVYSCIIMFVISYTFELILGYYMFSVIKYLSLALVFFLVPLSITFLKGFLHHYENSILFVYFFVSLFSLISLLGDDLGFLRRFFNVSLTMLTISFIFQILYFYRTRVKEKLPYEVYIFLPSLTVFECLKHIVYDKFGINMGMIIDLFTVSYIILLAFVSVVYMLSLSVGNYKQYEKSIGYLNERIKNEEKLYRWFVILLISLLEARDPYTKSHSERVARYSYNLAKIVYNNTYMPNFIELSAFLHDIGKFGVRDEVLFYPGKLSSEYYEEIKKHPEIGKELLDSVSIFRDLSDIAYMHHESIDGSGYPRKLRGNSLPLYVKISSIADSFDAMNSSRVYRNKLDAEKIITELINNAGKQFDENLVKVFIKNINRII